MAQTRWTHARAYHECRFGLARLKRDAMTLTIMALGGQVPHMEPSELGYVFTYPPLIDARSTATVGAMLRLREGQVCVHRTLDSP